MRWNWRKQSKTPDEESKEQMFMEKELAKDRTPEKVYQNIATTKYYMSERKGYDVGTARVVRERTAHYEPKDTQDELIFGYLMLYDGDGTFRIKGELERWTAQRENIPVSQVKLDERILESYCRENDIDKFYSNFREVIQRYFKQ